MTTPPPGIYPGIPEAEYRAWDALGSTDIKTLASHPAGVFRFRRKYPQQSNAFAIGNAAHALILEGRETPYVDATTRNTKAYKDYAAIHGPSLLAHEWDTVQRMRDAVFANPDAANLLTDHEPETSLIWDEGGTRLKGRLDGWRADERIIVDLKTARDVSPRGFGRAAGEYGYHAQAAQYSDGVAALTGEVPTYFIVAVEKEPPYLTAVYEVTADQIASGRETVREGIAAYHDANATGYWATNYPLQPLDLPMWAYTEMEIDL